MFHLQLSLCLSPTSALFYSEIRSVSMGPVRKQSANQRTGRSLLSSDWPTPSRQQLRHKPALLLLVNTERLQVSAGPAWRRRVLGNAPPPLRPCCYGGDELRSSCRRRMISTNSAWSAAAWRVRGRENSCRSPGRHNTGGEGLREGAGLGLLSGRSLRQRTPPPNHRWSLQVSPVASS